MVLQVKFVVSSWPADSGLLSVCGSFLLPKLSLATVLGEAHTESQPQSGRGVGETHATYLQNSCEDHMRLSHWLLCRLPDGAHNAVIRNHVPLMLSIYIICYSPNPPIPR